jgi:hypothetical protein
MALRNNFGGQIDKISKYRTHILRGVAVAETVLNLALKDGWRPTLTNVDDMKRDLKLIARLEEGGSAISRWMMGRVSATTSKYYDAFKSLAPAAKGRIIGQALKRIGKGLPYLSVLYAASVGFAGEGDKSSGFVGAGNEIARDVVAADLVEMGFVATIRLAGDMIGIDEHDADERLGRYYPWIYELAE